MNGNEHQRAIELITQRDVEAISAADVGWLAAHLAECHECSSFASALGKAERALRSFSVTAPVSLVETTRARVHARAEQLREQQVRVVLMAVSFCLGVLTSTLTAWIWWRCGAWVADKLGLPSGIVEPGVLLFWLLPAVVIAVLLVTFPPSVFEGSLMQRFLKEHVRGMQ